MDGREFAGSAENRSLTVEADLTGNGFMDMLRRRWILRKLGL